MLSSPAMMMTRPLLLGALLALATCAPAASITVQVADQAGAQLEDAVAWAVPRAGSMAKPTRQAAVEQVQKAFVPLVTVVQAGTLVRFPNRDEIRHHVYSFSPAKKFEIALYAGTPVAPILFDKPGEVVLGCNIHDNMIAYIYVVDTPWFGKAGANGRARIEGLPAGEYDVHVWHYQQAEQSAARAVTLGAEDGAIVLEASVRLKPRVQRPGAR